jgi:D-alanyl-D-alanine carboxypeptidase
MLHRRASSRHARRPRRIWLWGSAGGALAAALVLVPAVNLPASSADRGPADPRDAAASVLVVSPQRQAEARDASAAPAPTDTERIERAKQDALRRAAAERPSRGERRRPPAPEPPSWLKGCLPVDKHRATDHPNGQVPTSDLCRLGGRDHLLHGDAAFGWWKLDRAFRQRFGTGICITDSYRSYDAQAQVYASKPGLAAVPGTSTHGWGMAVDLCGGVESYDSPAHQWLSRHGARYGWVNPPWAQRYGTRPEPWHWEYVG